MRKDFLNMTINGIGPVELLVRKSGEIRLFSSKVNGSVLHLDKVSDNMLNSFKVPFLGTTPNPDIVMMAVVMLILPRDTNHWRAPISNW